MRFLTESAGVPLPLAMVGIVRRGWLYGGRAEEAGRGWGAVDQILLIVGNYTL